MQVAILSDIHDNIWNLKRALDQVKASNISRMLFLGDFCAPFTLKQLAEGFSGQVDAVFGNNDGDQHLLTAVASEQSNVVLHGPFAELEIDNRRIALTHYPEIARGLADGGYDAVFYGHDHTRFSGEVGATVLGNPGEIMGRFGSPSFGVYDTTEQSFQHVDV
jgi:uncharacterized protein